MRVFIPTQTFPPQMGGMENVMAALAEKFGKAGYAVTVLPKNQTPDSCNYQIVHRRLPKFLRNAYKRRYLAGNLTKDDLVICDSWKSVAAVPSHDGKLVVLAHGQEYLKTGRRAKQVQAALNRATHIVSSSEFTLDLIKGNWNIEHLHACMIPPTYMLADKPANSDSEPNGANDMLRLVSICRLEKRKGLQQAMEALFELGHTIPEWHWYIGGTGPQETELQALIDRFHLRDKVSLLGRVDETEKENLLSQADLFIMPSYQEGNSLEGFGISYAEAASHGLPAIAGCEGGAPEAVIDGMTGWCVDPTTNSELRDCLEQALINTSEREKRGANASDDFVKRLNGTASFTKFCREIEVAGL
jgi:phosphatidylinositol alpha-1,6-mannosyltransferase